MEKKTAIITGGGRIWEGSGITVSQERNKYFCSRYIKRKWVRNGSALQRAG